MRMGETEEREGEDAHVRDEQPLRLTEGSVSFSAYTSKIPHEGMRVFYNPRMQENRSISVITIRLLLKEWLKRGVRHVRLAFPLAASGIRILRILEENIFLWERLLSQAGHVEILANDLNPEAVRLIRRNLATKRIGQLMKGGLSIRIFQEDAVSLLAREGDYDYVNIDPYGTPNPFLSIALQRMKHQGILEVTLTDTAAVTGSAPRAGLRKYHVSIPFQPRYKHLISLHAFAGHVERSASMHDRAAESLLAVHEEHYDKLILRMRRNTHAAVERISRQQKASICPSCHTLLAWSSTTRTCPFCKHETVQSGPFSLSLCDDAWLTRFIHHAEGILTASLIRELERLKEYSLLEEPVILDTHQLSKQLGIHTISRKHLTTCLTEKGFRVSILPWHPTSIAISGKNEDSLWKTLAQCLNQEREGL